MVEPAASVAPSSSSFAELGAGVSAMKRLAMPDSEVSRITACVPSRSGAKGSSTRMRTRARLSSVSVISRTEPMRRPPTWTSSPLTSWPAFWNSRSYSWVLAPRTSSSATRTIANASAAMATPRAIVNGPSALSKSTQAVHGIPRAGAGNYPGFVYFALQGGSHSMPRGPREAPERNCRTNMLSELKSSSAGPDSTMRPFHSTAMYSATRLADMMSCVMTT